MDKTYFIEQSTSLTLVIVISLIFAVLGIYYSKKFGGINNYLTANRNIGLFSLTTSLVASALGAWILFGPVAAAAGPNKIHAPNADATRLVVNENNPMFLLAVR